MAAVDPVGSQKGIQGIHENFLIGMLDALHAIHLCPDRVLCGYLHRKLYNLMHWEELHYRTLSNFHKISLCEYHRHLVHMKNMKFLPCPDSSLKFYWHMCIHEDNFHFTMSQIRKMIQMTG